MLRYMEEQAASIQLYGESLSIYKPNTSIMPLTIAVI